MPDGSTRFGALSLKSLFAGVGVAYIASYVFGTLVWIIPNLLVDHMVVPDLSLPVPEVGKAEFADLVEFYRWSGLAVFVTVSVLSLGLAGYVAARLATRYRQSHALLVVLLAVLASSIYSYASYDLDIARVLRLLAIGSLSALIGARIAIRRDRRAPVDTEQSE